MNICPESFSKLFCQFSIVLWVEIAQSLEWVPTGLNTEVDSREKQDFSLRHRVQSGGEVARA